MICEKTAPEVPAAAIQGAKEVLLPFQAMLAAAEARSAARSLPDASGILETSAAKADSVTWAVAWERRLESWWGGLLVFSVSVMGAGGAASGGSGRVWMWI